MSLPLAAAAAFFRPPAAAPAGPQPARAWERNSAADVTDVSLDVYGLAANATHFFISENVPDPRGEGGALRAYTRAGVRDSSADRTVGGAFAHMSAPPAVEFGGGKIYIAASAGGGIYAADDPGGGGTADFTLVASAGAANSHCFALSSTHLYSMVWAWRLGYWDNGYGQIIRLSDNANVGTFRYAPGSARPSWMDDGPDAAFAYGDGLWVIPRGTSLTTGGGTARGFRLSADGLTLTREAALDFGISGPRRQAQAAIWGDALWLAAPTGAGGFTPALRAYRQVAA